MSWVKAGPVEWVSQDYPGYVIVRVGTGYEVYLEGKRVGEWEATWEAAVELAESDIAGRS